MNSLVNSNDPAENTYLRFETPEHIDIWKKYDYFQELNRIVRDNSRISCFSISKIKKGRIKPGYSLLQMWAHYGDNHRGVCIVLNKSKFLQENKKIIDSSGSIRYKNELSNPFIEIPFLETTMPETEQLSKLIKSIHREIFFTKMIEWSQENEFRIVNYSKPFNYYCSIKESLEALILGANLNEVYIPSINSSISQLKKHSIKLYKAVFDKEIKLERCFQNLKKRKYVTLDD